LSRFCHGHPRPNSKPNDSFLVPARGHARMELPSLLSCVIVGGLGGTFERSSGSPRFHDGSRAPAAISESIWSYSASAIPPLRIFTRASPHRQLPVIIPTLRSSVHMVPFHGRKCRD
jgi:hypothetical protein